MVRMNGKHKVVIDTNVFIHALFYNDPSCIDIMDLIENGSLDLFFAIDTIGELMYILKNFAKRNMVEDEGIKLLEEFAGLFYTSRSVNTSKVEPVKLPKDKADTMFLKCAIKGDVDFLITNDVKSRLLKLTGYRFTPITASDYISLINQSSEKVQ